MAPRLALVRWAAIPARVTDEPSTGSFPEAYRLARLEPDGQPILARRQPPAVLHYPQLATWRGRTYTPPPKATHPSASVAARRRAFT